MLDSGSLSGSCVRLTGWGGNYLKKRSAGSRVLLQGSFMPRVVQPGAVQVETSPLLLSLRGRLSLKAPPLSAGCRLWLTFRRHSSSRLPGRGDGTASRLRLPSLRPRSGNKRCGDSLTWLLHCLFLSLNCGGLEPCSLMEHRLSVQT